jgi:hypothetical protein
MNTEKSGSACNRNRNSKTRLPPNGVGHLTPHLSQAVRGPSLETTSVELPDEEPYPKSVAERAPLRLALRAMKETALDLPRKYGFERSDVLSIELHGTPAPRDDKGYVLHTRAVITSAKKIVSLLLAGPDNATSHKAPVLKWRTGWRCLVGLALNRQVALTVREGPW